MTTVPGTLVQAGPLMVLSGVLLVAYLWAASRTRATPRPWSDRRVRFWAAGCALVAVAASPWPGDDADPRVHMVRHLLLGMAAPLALVLGAPVSLVLRTAPPPVRRSVAGVLRSRPSRVLGHPVTAAVLSTGGLAVIMLTPLHAAAGHHALAHLGVHAHYLAAGYLFAWSIAGPDPSPHRPGRACRVAVLVAAAAAHAVLAKYLYAQADLLPLAHTHGADAVRDAARLMYYGGDAAEVLLAAALFADWYRRRPRTPARAPTGRPAPGAAPPGSPAPPSPAPPSTSRP